MAGAIRGEREKLGGGGGSGCIAPWCTLVYLSTLSNARRFTRQGESAGNYFEFIENRLCNQWKLKYTSIVYNHVLGVTVITENIYTKQECKVNY